METRKDPGAVGALNLLFPGAGYIYAGNLWWGIPCAVIASLLGGGALFGSLDWPYYAGWAIGAAMWGFLDQRKENARLDAADVAVCPFCAERIKAAARVCRYCQRDVRRAGSV